MTCHLLRADHHKEFKIHAKAWVDSVKALEATGIPILTSHGIEILAFKVACVLPDGAGQRALFGFQSIHQMHLFDNPFSHLPKMLRFDAEHCDRLGIPHYFTCTTGGKKWKRIVEMCPADVRGKLYNYSAECLLDFTLTEDERDVSPRVGSRKGMHSSCCRFTLHDA